MAALPTAVCSRPRAASCSPATMASTLMAVKSDTGQMLWSHRLPGTFWGAPSTVMVDKRQLVLMPAGQTLTAFALGSPTTPRHASRGASVPTART